MLNSFDVMTTQGIGKKNDAEGPKASGGASVLGMAGGAGTGCKKLLLFRPGLRHFIMAAQTRIVTFFHITGMGNAIVTARALVARIEFIMTPGTGASHDDFLTANEVMANRALPLGVQRERGEMPGHGGMACRAVGGGVNLVGEHYRLFSLSHLHRLLRHVGLLGEGGHGHGHSKQRPQAECQQLFHEILSSLETTQ